MVCTDCCCIVCTVCECICWSTDGCSTSPPFKPNMLCSNSCDCRSWLSVGSCCNTSRPSSPMASLKPPFRCTTSPLLMVMLGVTNEFRGMPAAAAAPCADAVWKPPLFRLFRPPWKPWFSS